MKLLGSILNRGPKKEKTECESPSTGRRNRHKKSDFISPDRRNKQRNRKQLYQQEQQQQQPRQVDPPINLAIQQNQPKYYHNRNDSKSSKSIALSKYGDDTTLDGNDTLYDWSLADNAPSVGSAGEIFAENNHYNRSSSRRKWFRSGYASSSDDDDDDDNSSNSSTGGHESMNFKYCMLSNSPPPKNITPSSKTGEDTTPMRTGNTTPLRKDIENDPSRRKLDFSNQAHEQNTGQQKESKPPLQMLNREKPKHTALVVNTSAPVDVDQFIGIITPCTQDGPGKENKVPQKSNHSTSLLEGDKMIMEDGNANIIDNVEPLAPNMKGCILNALNDSEDTAFDSLYDSIDVNDSTNSNGDTPNASMRNLVDSSSPYAKKRSKPKHRLSSSVGEDMIQKGMTSNYIEDLDLPSDKNRNGWKQNDDNVIITKNPRQVETHNQESVSKKGKMKRKSIKKQMQNTLHSLVGTKNKNLELKREERNKVRKAKVSRQLSDFSMAPLTGIEDGFVRQNLKTRKELLMEMQRRKLVEKREIEMKAEKQLRFEEYKRERLEETASRKADIQKRKHEIRKMAGPEVNTSDAVVDLDRQRNKEKLQNWVMGFSHLNFDDNQPDKDDSLSQLPSSYGNQEEQSIVSIPPQDASTACIDNTTGQKNSCRNDSKSATLCSKGSFAFETNFPDEDSSAHSPFSVIPSRNQSNFLCVICKSEERTHLASPCMHFSFCEHCVKKLKQNGKMRCSVCNEVVSTFSRVFF
jgi:hypothetical protein